MSAPDQINYSDWIGRSQSEDDVASAGPIERLAALLDHEALTQNPIWADGEVPPLGHWLYFLPCAPQSEIGEDGHPKRGGFLPPVALPRRMWAGGRLTFHAAPPLGAAIQRKSTILKITPKTGASGDMVFITVQHAIMAQGTLVITEEQDIVYREAPKSGAPAPKPDAAASAEPDSMRSVTPDAVQLFRYSALTFNGHRIHYDRDYAMKVEAYPGLVVHGPLIATLLMDHFLRENPRARVTEFSFRAQRPLFDGAKIDLCLRKSPDGVLLWARDPAGNAAMSAEISAT